MLGKLEFGCYIRKKDLPSAVDFNILGIFSCPEFLDLIDLKDYIVIRARLSPDGLNSGLSK